MMSLKIIIDSTAGYSPEELEQLDLRNFIRSLLTPKAHLLQEKWTA